MVSVVLLIGFVSMIELMLGSALLALLFTLLRKARWPSYAKRALLIVFGVILVSPALAPAGFMALIPLPLGVLLAFLRKSEDVTFLFRTLWFIVPSMLVTGLVFGYMARRLFPKH